MIHRFARLAVACCAVLAVAGGAWWYFQRGGSTPQVESDEVVVKSNAPSLEADSPIRISRQARENLGLVSKPLQPTTFWRTIELPGVIVDRPGVSDRGVVSPVSGVVTKIVAFPGDTVLPNAPLFSIRLVSESLHASQMELFKAMRDIEIAEGLLERLSDLAESGIIPKARIREIENDIKRLNATVDAYRQDLQARGLPPEGIEAASRGKFVTEVVVRAPNEKLIQSVEVDQDSNSGSGAGDSPFYYEVQSLNVELGEQVQTGQVLCDLADHRNLFIEGRAFKDDLPLVQRAAKNGWNVEVDFGSEEKGDWPPPPAQLPINYVANVVDPASRTFAFYLPLENQSQSFSYDGKTRLLWRFRPGGRVRLRIPVEKLENVFVLPREAVVQEGPEAFVFRQNGDYFNRMPVRVLHEDRLYTVLANDRSVTPGFYVAQNAAASLNRVLKAKIASGAPADVHVHADGTVHAVH